MKKLVILLLQVLFASSLMAQSKTDSINILRDFLAGKNQKFLTVKGIELKPGLLMKDFLVQAEAKGWRKSKNYDYLKEDYGAYELEGTFYSRPDCSILVVPTLNNKKNVGIIGISFPKSNSFKQLKNEYDNLKYSLGQKYYLSESIEKFDNDYVESNGSNDMKLFALSDDEGIFESRFLLSNEPGSAILGCIVLKITHLTVDYNTSHYVSISYYTSDFSIEQLGTAEDDL